MFLKNLNNLQNILSPWITARSEHAVNALARFFQFSGNIGTLPIYLTLPFVNRDVENAEVEAE
jgi:hypothetical protein